MLRRLFLRLGLSATLLAASNLAISSFHLWQINEIYSNASGTVQFIEFTTNFGGQQFLNFHSLKSIQGGTTNTFPFGADLPGDSANKKFLVGTQGFANLGIVAPDYIVPDGFLFLTNGTINFADVDFVSYAALPTDGVLSINRLGATATNSPTNFAGVTGTIQAASTPPGAPAAPTVTAGLGQVTVSFTPPAVTGSSPITAYTATCGTQSISGSASPLVVSNLPAGVAVTCTVLATNGQGNGPASPPSASVTPLGVPGAPVISNVSGGDGQAIIDFQAPGNSGGSPITGYTANCGGQTASGAGSPLQVFGLANGVQVACTVFASNAQGNGAPSAAVNVVPAGNPGTPTNVAATRGDRQATITFTASAANGSAILSYTVTCNGGSFTATGQNSPIVVTGLTNGTTYSCAVFATNGIGNSAASSPPVSVVPAGLPGAPINVSASPDDAQAMILFDAPPNNGGSPIQLYTATCNPGSHVASGANAPLLVTGLTNGTIYTCAATATNGVGTGPSSVAVSVTPARAPDPPVIGTPIAGNAQVSLFFTPPAFNGGSPITGYAATCTPSGFATGQSSPITITGLTNGVTYTCSVNASNAVSFGSPSATVGVTPTVSPTLSLVSVRSRKVHGAAGPFDLPIQRGMPARDDVTVEPRSNGGGHTMILTFNDTVSDAGALTIFDNLGNQLGSGIHSAFANTVNVTLTGVPDAQRLIFQLSGVNGSLVTAVGLAFLVGDINDSRSVNASDILGIKARRGTTTDGTNYLFDLNLSGNISQADVTVAKSRSGTKLPAVPAPPNMQAGIEVDVEGNQIPNPSRSPGTSSPHAGLNGANGPLAGGPLADNAWAVLAPPGLCTAARPALARIWYHNLDSDLYRTNGGTNYFAILANEALVYGFVAGPEGTMNSIQFNESAAAVFVPGFMSLSTTPCDFDASQIGGPNSNCYVSRNGTSTIAYHATNGAANPLTCKLIPGTRYYINFRNQNALLAPNEDACLSVTGNTNTFCGGLLTVH